MKAAGNVINIATSALADHPDCLKDDSLAFVLALVAHIGSALAYQPQACGFDPWPSMQQCWESKQCTKSHRLQGVLSHGAPCVEISARVKDPSGKQNYPVIGCGVTYNFSSFVKLAPNNQPT